MSCLNDVELAAAVRELKQEISEESAVLSELYAEELKQRTDACVSDELLQKSRELNVKIERCMQLWQELKARVAQAESIK